MLNYIKKIRQQRRQELLDQRIADLQQRQAEQEALLPAPDWDVLGRASFELKQMYAQDLEIASWVGRFEFVAHLGRGTFGTVFAVREQDKVRCEVR